MMMTRGARGRGRANPRDSFNPTHHHNNRQPPPPRDSDASICSSRPSSASLSAAAAAIPISDRSYQAMATRSINAYLSSYNLPFSLRSTLPTARDILQTLAFVLSRLTTLHPDFNPNAAAAAAASAKLDEDLFAVLKSLGCPVKLNRSALRAPGTPHSWPALLAAIHWLVQLATFSDPFLADDPSLPYPEDDGDSMFVYTRDSYLSYIRGDDDSVEAIDSQFVGKLEKEKDAMEEHLRALQTEAEELHSHLQASLSAANPIEDLEKKRTDLEGDVNKFRALIDQYAGKIAATEKVLQEKLKELESKEEETRRVLAENEGLKKRVKEQNVNSREAERIKRELQAMERDIAAAESARNSLEEKFWDLDPIVGHKFMELEQLSIEFTHALKRLKLGVMFEYELNPKGLTPSEVLGVDYKSTLKPALDSYADSIKTLYMKMLEENILLQEKSVENATRIDARKKRLTELQFHLGEMDAQLNLLKKEIQDHTSKCEMEAKMMIDVIESDARDIGVAEKEAEEILKSTKWKLEETVKQSEEDVHKCASELFALIDSVSKHKEYMSSKISEMKDGLTKAAGAIADAYRNSLPYGIDLLPSTDI